MMEWPEWWEWDLELSPHLLKRMIDRGFNESDLRLMLQEATELAPNHEPGRWVARMFSGNRSWEVVLEPLPDDRIVLVITAYFTD